MPVLATTAAALVTASLALTPQNGGTVEHPRGHEVTADVWLSEPSTITGLEVWYGRGIELHREGVPECSIATISRLGPDGCPEKSIMGSGPRYANADVVDPDAPPRMVFVNGPGGRLIAYMTLQRPARIRAPMVSKVVQSPRSRFPSRDAWPFPRVFQTVAGLPVTVLHLRLAFGNRPWAKDYISTTGCPRGGWAWRIRVHLQGAGFQDVDGKARCRR